MGRCGRGEVRRSFSIAASRSVGALEVGRRPRGRSAPSRSNRHGGCAGAPSRGPSEMQFCAFSRLPCVLEVGPASSDPSLEPAAQPTEGVRPPSRPRQTNPPSAAGLVASLLQRRRPRGRRTRAPTPRTPRAWRRPAGRLPGAPAPRSHATVSDLEADPYGRIALRPYRPRRAALEDEPSRVCTALGAPTSRTRRASLPIPHRPFPISPQQRSVSPVSSSGAASMRSPAASGPHVRDGYRWTSRSGLSSTSA